MNRDLGEDGGHPVLEVVHIPASRALGNNRILVQKICRWTIRCLQEKGRRARSGTVERDVCIERRRLKL